MYQINLSQIDSIHTSLFEIKEKKNSSENYQ